MELFFWCLAVLSGLGIVHTYLIYPMWVMRKAERIGPHRAYYSWGTNEVARVHTARPPATEVELDQTAETIEFHKDSSPAAPQEKPCYLASKNGKNWPRVTVLMAVHNEEKVLAKKLKGLLEQDYAGEYEIYVGSDNSNDRTNEILQAYAAKYPQLHLQLFASRQGKPGIINQLRQLAAAPGSDHFYLLTDASVMLTKDAVSQLILPSLDRPDLAVMDARMIHTGLKNTGISKTEDRYISREVLVKQAEGKLWGYMIGPFGGCFALRSDLFVAVPDNFLVDDFFLCLAAYEGGGRGISVPAAHCYEGVGQKIREEFRRKVRISSGNWQNALRFRRQWWPPVGSLPFAFFSHKILRWLTPFLLIAIGISLGFLSFCFGNYWARLAFYALMILLIVPALLDQLLSRLLDIHWQPLRTIHYFLAMNLALLVGFIRFLNGIQSNVWQPSERH